MLAGANKKPRVNLLKNPNSKIGRSSVVHGDSNYATMGASEKGGDPSGRVWSPEHDAVAFANAAGNQLARKTERKLGNIAISPAGHAIATTLGVGLFVAEALEIHEIFAKACSHNLSVTHLLRLMSPGDGSETLESRIKLRNLGGSTQLRSFASAEERC